MNITCPSTGDGEEPVVMVAGVKAERCRSCADGTLSDGFWLVEDVGHASHPSLSNWLDVFEGQLVTQRTGILYITVPYIKRIM